MNAEESSSLIPKKSAGMFVWLADRPWIFVVALFAVIIAVWTVAILIGVNNAPVDVREHPELLLKSRPNSVPEEVR